MQVKTALNLARQGEVADSPKDSVYKRDRGEAQTTPFIAKL